MKCGRSLPKKRISPAKRYQYCMRTDFEGSHFRKNGRRTNLRVQNKICRVRAPTGRAMVLGMDRAKDLDMDWETELSIRYPIESGHKKCHLEGTSQGWTQQENAVFFLLIAHFERTD